MTDFRALRKFLEPNPIEYAGITFHFQRITTADVAKIEEHAQEDKANFWLPRMLAGAVQNTVRGDEGEKLSDDEAHAFVEAVNGLGNPIVDKAVELCGPFFDKKVRSVHKATEELTAKIESGEFDLSDDGESGDAEREEKVPPEDHDGPLG